MGAFCELLLTRCQPRRLHSGEDRRALDARGAEHARPGRRRRRSQTCVGDARALTRLPWTSTYTTNPPLVGKLVDTSFVRKRPKRVTCDGAHRSQRLEKSSELAALSSSRRSPPLRPEQGLDEVDGRTAAYFGAIELTE